MFTMSLGSTCFPYMAEMYTSQQLLTMWFIYQLEFIHCHAQYGGSTQNVASCFKNHKSNTHLKNNTSSGMAKHFSDSYPNDDNDQQKPQLRITLIDFMHTSNVKLQTAGHVPGPQCRCIECGKLKKT